MKDRFEDRLRLIVMQELAGLLAAFAQQQHEIEQALELEEIELAKSQYGEWS